MPAAPDHFGRCSAINGKGPTLISQLPKILLLEPIEFKKMAEKKDTIVLVIRSYEAFGGQHIAGAYHIDFGGNFATFAGWILPPEKDILIVAESFEQAQQANIWLRRVGLDRAAGYLEGGMFAWAKEGLPTKHIQQLSADELYKVVTADKEVTVVDVRAAGEYGSGHIEGAVNIPAPELRTRYKELNKSRATILVCSTGHRSSMAASILKQHKFEDVYNAAGGMTGYSAAGYASECAVCVAPHVPGFTGKKE